MKSIVMQVRDMEKIEKELNANKVGLLGFIDKEENLIQIIHPYLYENKNIYFFFDESDEIFSTLVFDSSIRFTIYKNENQKKNSSSESQSFKFFQVTFKGNIKQETEKKVIDELYASYLQKYNYDKSKLAEGHLDTLRLVFLDTEEIDAKDVSGE